MREQWVQMQSSDASRKLEVMAVGILNLRANFAVLIRVLEDAGVFTPERLKAAVEALNKATDKTAPLDPIEKATNEEPVKEDNHGSGGAS